MVYPSLNFGGGGGILLLGMGAIIPIHRAAFYYFPIPVEFDFGTDMLLRITRLSAEDTVACSSSKICKQDAKGGELDTYILTGRADFPVVSFFLRSVTRPRYGIS